MSNSLFSDSAQQHYDWALDGFKQVADDRCPLGASHAVNAVLSTTTDELCETQISADARDNLLKALFLATPNILALFDSPKEKERASRGLDGITYLIIRWAETFELREQRSWSCFQQNDKRAAILASMLNIRKLLDDLDEDAERQLFRKHA